VSFDFDTKSINNVHAIKCFPVSRRVVFQVVVDRISVLGLKWNDSDQHNIPTVVLTCNFDNICNIRFVARIDVCWNVGGQWPAPEICQPDRTTTGSNVEHLLRVVVSVSGLSSGAIGRRASRYMAASSQNVQYCPVCFSRWRLFWSGELAWTDAVHGRRRFGVDGLAGYERPMYPNERWRCSNSFFSSWYSAAVYWWRGFFCCWGHTDIGLVQGLWTYRHMT